MDTWLIWVAIFSVGILAGPLPQRNEPSQQEPSQTKRQINVDNQHEGFQSSPNLHSNGFQANNHRFQLPSFFGQSRANPGFTGLNQNVNPGEFFAGQTQTNPFEVVRVVHPSITGGIGSLEELGITPSAGGNNFQGQGVSEIGTSSAEFGIGSSNLGNGAFGSAAFNPLIFGNQNFGHGGFQSPVVTNPVFQNQRPPFIAPNAFSLGLNNQGFQARSGFGVQNFANTGFGNNAFGNGFNAVPFSPGPPTGGNFPSFTQNTGHFGPGSFIPANLNDPSFIPNFQPQPAKVFIHSVPVVVNVVNDTHGSVIPHPQAQPNVNNDVEKERNTGSAFVSLKASQTNSNIRAGSSDLKSEINSETNMSKNNFKVEAPISIGMALPNVDSSLSFQSDNLPSGRAFTSSSKSETSNTFSPERFTAPIGSKIKNAIQSKEANKIISITDTLNPNEPSKNSPQNDVISNIQLFDQSLTKSVLPVPGALSSFALIGTPPAVGVSSTQKATEIIDLKQDIPITRFISTQTFAQPEITTLRPQIQGLGIISTTPIPSLPMKIQNDPLRTDIPSIKAPSVNTPTQLVLTSPITQLDVVPVTNVKDVASDISQNKISSSTVSPTQKVLHIGDPVSIITSVSGAKVEPAIMQTDIIQSKSNTQQISPQDIIGKLPEQLNTPTLQLDKSQLQQSSISSTQLGFLETLKGSNSPSKSQELRSSIATLLSTTTNNSDRLSASAPSQSTTFQISNENIQTSGSNIPKELAKSSISPQTSITQNNPNLVISHQSIASIPNLNSNLAINVSDSIVSKTSTPSLNKPLTKTITSDTNTQSSTVSKKLQIGSPVLVNIGASTPPPFLSQSTVSPLNSIPPSSFINTTPSPFIQISTPNQQPESTNTRTSNQAIIIVEQFPSKPSNQAQNTGVPSTVAISQPVDFIRNSIHQSDFPHSTNIIKGTTSSSFLSESIGKRLGEQAAANMETTTHTSNAQILNKSNVISVGQSAVIPPISQNSAITKTSSSVKSPAAGTSQLTVHTALSSNLNSPPAIKFGDVKNPTTATQELSASEVSPVVGKHALESSNISTSSTEQFAQQFPTSTNISEKADVISQNTMTGSNMISEKTDLINNPNLILAIPLSLLSQPTNLFSSSSISDSVIHETGINSRSSDILNNFSYTTDPKEVFRLIKKVQANFQGPTSSNNNVPNTPSNNNVPITPLAGNRNIQSTANLQSSSSIPRTVDGSQGKAHNANQHLVTGANGSNPSTATNLQQESIKSTSMHLGKPALPVISRLPSSVANTQQLLPHPINEQLRPDTIASLSRIFGFGIPLPSPSSLPQNTGKQSVGSINTQSNQKSQSNSKIGNNLKRESPHL